MYKINKPWVEKYRPENFDDIVLDSVNRKILTNILEYNTFPNLLLYGPPGTGKTTTIINLINRFQENNDNKQKSLMIHLNASDERGIDIIRNQINTFVNSQSLFIRGIKFVVLDEVDYMTKNAQQALKHLIHIYNDNVRFCLICNYISRIDESLKNEFIHLRFNQLPEEHIIHFLNKINISEKLNLTNEMLHSIQQLFKSDIRSMVNYMQSNENKVNPNMIITKNTWSDLINHLKKDIKQGIKCVHKIRTTYNVDIKHIAKECFTYVINNKILIHNEFLKFAEFIIHSIETNSEDLIIYFVERMHNFFLSSL